MSEPLQKPLSPKLAQRRQAMLEAAREIFLEKGYERTTLSDIVTRSGGSRSTLVDLFGCKAGLFVAVMRESSIQISQTFDVLEESDTPPRTMLRRFANRFLTTLFGDHFAMAFLRILIAEGPRFPELATAFLRHGPETRDQKLATYFRHCIDKGLLRPHDPIILSQIFCGMIVGDFDLRGAIGENMAAQEEQMRAHADAAVDIFLTGILPTGANPSA